jgi:hypothetical protein
MKRWSVLAFAFSIGCVGTGTTPPDPPDPPDPVVERATVFLNFEGVTLQPGAEDATANTAGFFETPQTMQPYKSTAADRATQIAAITTSVKAILAPFDLEITTTRPTTGPYDMLVFGGSSQDVGLTSGVDGIAAIDCLDLNPSNIVLLFGDAFPVTAPDVIASLSVTALGITNGIPTSTVDNDCMCWGGGGCSQSGRCTVGGANTAITPDNGCANGATKMDEHARFVAAFGVAP